MPTALVTISPRQCKAARALLSWSIDQLAERAGINPMTIVRFEKEQQTPRKTTLEKIELSFVQAGLEFGPENLVRERTDQIITLTGSTGLAAFFDDVYQTATELGGVFQVYGVDENKFIEASIKAGIGFDHPARMETVEDIWYNVIISDTGKASYKVSYGEYRSLPPHQMPVDIPFYIYGDKVAMIMWRDPIKIIVMRDPDLTDAYRRQFEMVWDQAKPV